MAASSQELPPEMESDDEESGDWEERQATGAAEQNGEENEEEEKEQEGRAIPLLFYGAAITQDCFPTLCTPSIFSSFEMMRGLISTTLYVSSTSYARR